MKNNYSRFIIIALITIIVFLYALTVRGYAAGLPMAVQETVTGVVKDKQGMPLPGVTVTVKGRNRGTVTNIDGEYEITVDPQRVLVFSFLGFKQVEVSVGEKRQIDVQLEEDITALGEVEINAGYYNTTRRESTGNISRVTAEEIEMQPVVSPLQALQGRMAGVEVIPGGNQPGMAPSIRIRGRNSLREEGNYPLYIIDGVPINSTPIETNSILGSTGIDPLNNISLSNIESIEVLKDADATAIYGSRGANGVVLVTTKKGRFTESSIELTAYTGASVQPERIDMLNTEQYLQVRRRGFENDGVEPTARNAYDLIVWDQERYTDWQEYFYGGTAEVNNVNLAMNGGGENTTFRLSGTYHEQGSIYPGDYDYQKLTGGFSLSHYSKNKKLLLNFSLNYGLTDIASVGNLNLSGAVFRLPPNAPDILKADGELNWAEWAEAGLSNPFSGFFNKSKTTSNDLISNLTISYDVLKHLKFRTSLGFTNFQSEELVKRPKRSYNPQNWSNIENSSSHQNITSDSYIIEPQLIYEERFGKTGLNAIVGGSIQERNFAKSSIMGAGYVSESQIGNLGAADKFLNGSGEESRYRYAAVFGRLGMDWNKRFFLNLSGRRDGSSRFGPGKRLANFWSFGGAWIFSGGPDYVKGDIFSFGKLRASYGTSGSDQIGDYQYLDAFEATPGPGGLYPTQLFNPNYSWEVNKKVEAAIDLGFLGDRINLSGSWYRNRSSNQLVGYALPATTGFTSVQANLPATVTNTGIEIELSTSNLFRKNFSWKTYLNLTVPRNELTTYPEIEKSSYANTYKVGYPLDILLLYRYKGIDSETGFYEVEDINSDERYDFKDRVVIQNRGRQFYGGLGNVLEWKRLSFQFLWQFVKQKGRLDFFDAGHIGNQSDAVLQSLQEGSKFQKVSASSQAYTAYLRTFDSSFSVVDASFIRLKTLSLTYSFPSSWKDPIGVKDLNLFLNGHNLFTLTSYKGMDPEMPGNGQQFSNLRTVTGGLKIQF